MTAARTIGRSAPGAGDGLVLDERADETRDLIARVGDRVRAGRRERGMPRRELAERSGVSQRYLAQLEAGEGNASIALLLKVSRALDCPIATLVSDDPQLSTEARAIAERYDMASDDQRHAVVEVLGGRGEGRAGRIALIGLRGAGKSTLGRLVAQELGMAFSELNTDIEEQSGMPVEEVMALYGQEGYRRLERQALERIVATTLSSIVAVAGGIVAEPETFSYLLRHFHTVWLKASPHEHMNRVRAQGDERPMAGNPKAMEELRSILTTRETLYARAEAMVDTTGKPLDESRTDLRRVVLRLAAGKS